MRDGRPELLFGLPPILDAGVRTLILGSFPSPASLAGQHYYAHRQNQFWRLLGVLLGEPLPELDYLDKQRCLLAHRIGVWDVYRQCRRQGALDAAIQSPETNDFACLAHATRRNSHVSASMAGRPASLPPGSRNGATQQPSCHRPARLIRSPSPASLRSGGPDWASRAVTDTARGGGRSSPRLSAPAAPTRRITCRVRGRHAGTGDAPARSCPCTVRALSGVVRNAPGRPPCCSRPAASSPARSA
jgi:hypoxanthine-DNA glycosylase